MGSLNSQSLIQQQEQRKSPDMDVRARRSTRETSPDRAKVAIQPRVKPLRKVQVVYYLSRNGQLEHPHYMEVTQLANQQLRLKDVMERLTVLRGKGMPSLYSWSCKRSYKNGYVWNDLAENDIIHPAEGAEYVLKGSELVEGCTEKFQQLHVGNRVQHIPEPNFHPKRAPLSRRSRHKEPVEVENMRDEEHEYQEEEGEEDEEKTSYTSSNTSRSRCSRGVSTDEIEGTQKNYNRTELTLEDGSPPSTSSTVSDKANEGNSNSKRFEEADPVDSVLAKPILSRNSVLLQLIACGSMVSGKPKNAASLKQSPVNIPAKNTSLHKGVLCKTGAKLTEEDMINYISENPRFGNLQSEEKEYFSGSIVESMCDDRVSIASVLKKSSSYKEERSSKGGLGETVEEAEEKKLEKSVKGKCIPRKKVSATSSKQSKK